MSVQPVARGCTEKYSCLYSQLFVSVQPIVRGCTANFLLKRKFSIVKFKEHLKMHRFKLQKAAELFEKAAELLLKRKGRYK